MSTQISLEEFEASRKGAGAGSSPSKRPRQKEDKAPRDSAQIEFAAFLKASDAPLYKSRDGVIYEYVGTHWQALDTENAEKMAFDWLSVWRRDKCNEKNAASCIASACLYLHQLPEPDKKSEIILIPVKNGTLHIEREGLSLYPHSPSDNLTFCLNCNYEPGARSPLFNDFINESVPDLDVQKFLQEYTGYTLFPDVRHHLAVWLLGSGGNGKGVFSDVLQSLHGKPVAASIGAGQLSGFRLEHLVGASLITVDETPQRIDEQQLKILISGGLIEVDRKFKSSISVKSQAKWLVCGNNLPSLSDQTDGFWRRWLIIKFNQKPRQVVPLLAQRITDGELSGVLNWAIEGLERLLSRGSFDAIPDSMRDDKDSARTAANSVAGWFEDVEPIVIKGEHEGVKGMSSDKIYHNYNYWCQKNGMKAVSSINFWQRIDVLAPAVVRFRRGSDRVRCASMLVPEID